MQCGANRGILRRPIDVKGEDGGMRRFVIVMLFVAAAATSVDTREAKGVEPVGPFCALTGGVNCLLMLFALPSGGNDYLHSGSETQTGTPVSGPATVSGNSLSFSVSGSKADLPGLVYTGVVDLQTGTGSGKCFVDNPADCNCCGKGTDVTYKP